MNNIAVIPTEQTENKYLSPEHLSELIQSIYSSSIENNFLTSFLKIMCETCRLRSATAVIFKVQEMSIHNVWEWGNNHQESEAELSDDIYREDPLIQKIMNSETNQFYSTNLDIPDWRKTADPRILEWSRLTGITESAGTMILLDDSFALTIYFQRGTEHPNFKREEIQFWNQLTTHIEKSAQIHQHLSQRKKIALETPAILDSFPLPTLLINSSLEVSMINQQAKEWLDDSNFVFLNDRKVHLRDETKSNILRLKTSQLINAISINIEDNEEQIFQWKFEQESITFVLKPLEKTTDQGDSYRGALCFIHQANRSITPPINALRKIFSLSQREAEICQLLSTGVDTNAIAEQFNLSIHTVRDMLKKRIFIKCGCNSQNSLIALLLTSPAIFI